MQDETKTTTTSQLIGDTKLGSDQDSSAYSTEDVEGTPFTLIQRDGAFLTWGRYQITPKFETKEQCIKYLDTNQWHVFVNAMIAIVETHAEYKKKQAEESEANSVPLYERM